MKWTIRLELTPDGNPPITYDIGTITRAIADLSPEEIGLTLEEGQQLLRGVAYGGPDAPLRDITAGDNWYYYAHRGYDQATGLGVPDFWNLFKALKPQ
jgi:hypothetical protein